MNHIKIYAEKVEAFAFQNKQNKQLLFYLGCFRLLLFLGTGWFFINAFRKDFNSLDFFFGLLLLLAFAICLFFSYSVKSKHTIIEQLIRINQNELDILKDQRSIFDTGEKYISNTNNDLNLFGNNSLYHLLNRTATIHGNQHLAGLLQKPFLNKTDIDNYQECVKELSTNIDFRQQLLAHTLLIGITDNNLDLEVNQADDSIKNIIWRFLSIAWPAGAIAVLIFGILKNHDGLILFYGIAGLALMSLIVKKTNRFYKNISKRSDTYFHYSECFKILSQENFVHPYLKNISDKIKNSSAAFKKLSRLASIFDLRLSPIGIILNGLFLFDLQCALLYLKWTKQHKAEAALWFNLLGEIECLNSIASFHYNKPGFVFPTCTQNKIEINALGLGHPFMNPNLAVTNDINLGNPEQLHLITGSNMAGKSTFLRAVGLNTLLAQIGAPVFAKSFNFSPLKILTSFHHIDSLEESTSYFYAELKSLQHIIQSVEKGQRCLIILDELMRGTNSLDKHAGTALLIKKLLQYNCLTLVATHDTDLSVLENNYPGKLANFCFESEIVNGELSFDFKMKNGVAQSRNATYLMQKMNII